MQSKNIERYDIVISGIGPGALATAWEGIKQGKSVLIISNRTDDFIRMQRVALNARSRDYLLHMLIEFKPAEMGKEDKQFIETLHQSTTVALKDIERFIKRRVDEIPEKRLTFLYNSELSKIEMDKEILSVVPKKNQEDKKSEIPGKETVYSFDYIVGADGVKHHAANLLNEAERKNFLTSPDSSKKYKDNQFFFTELPVTDLVKNNVSLYLTIEANNELILPEKKDFVITTDKKAEYLCYIAMDLQSYEKSKHKKIKCSVIFELLSSEPKNKLQDDKDLFQNKFLEYIKPLISDYFQKISPENKNLNINLDKPSKKHGVEKDKLKMQEFELKRMQVNHAAIKINNKNFILLGDSVLSPFYHFGQGLNDALADAQQVGKIFNGKLSLDQYNLYCQQRIEDSNTHEGFYAYALDKTLFAKHAESEVNAVLAARESYHGLLERLEQLRSSSVPEHKINKLKHQIDSQYREGHIAFLSEKNEFEKSIVELNLSSLKP